MGQCNLPAEKNVSSTIPRESTLVGECFAEPFTIVYQSIWRYSSNR